MYGLRRNTVRESMARLLIAWQGTSKMNRVELNRYWRLSNLRARLAGKSFFRNRRGSTTIEFAMIAVPFFGLITAIFETGLVYFESSQLQEVTEKASRSVLTNSANSGITYQTFLNTYVCPNLSSMINCANLQIEIDNAGSTWNTAANYTQNNIYSTTYNPNTVFNMPQPGQIAIVRIVYPMNPVVSILTGGAFGGGPPIQTVTAGLTNANGTMVNMLMGIYAFKVEP